MPDKFPYTFAVRNDDFKRAKPTFHDSLSDHLFDIAFDVTWTAISPIAANPCSEPGPSTAPENDQKHYGGYNKRWLMTDGKLAISPFTVKSAIANGFANLLGGCYRVNSEVIVDHTHAHSEPGQYPYTGAYKRYRVGMEGQSKPGIVTDIKKIAGKGYEFTIRCAKEFYLDAPLPAGINPGDRVFVTKTDRGFRPAILSNPSLTTTGEQEEIAVYYLEPFQYGMNLDKSHRLHTHRFIQLQEGTVTGIIPFLNFKNLNLQQTLVYMGQYNNNPAFQWYEDLKRLHPGSWVYYEEFNGQVTHIGQNFLFKALFCHSDTIPPNQETCTDMNLLCPRCQMFGMTDTTGKKDLEAVGYRGRFKASTLVSNICLEKPETITNRIPYENDQKKFATVNLHTWKSNGAVVARQFLMPIAGQPKPNKRDVNGYFNPNTGLLKGSKKYRHGTLATANLQEWGQKIQENDQKTDWDEKEKKFIYSHKIRNYAVLCEKDITFSGTIGAENCLQDEVAALIMLLENRIAGHGFKIGLGKSWGLGSMTSVINRIWFRMPESDGWESISCNEKPIHLTMPELEKKLEGVTKALEDLKSVQDIKMKINTVDGHENRKLKFPESLRKYWTEALKTGLNG